MRCKELGRIGRHNHDKPEEPKTKLVWRPKVKSQVQSAEASVNMVFMLPSEFSALQIKDSSQEEESIRLTLDPQQAMFENRLRTMICISRPSILMGLLMASLQAKCWSMVEQQ